MNDYTEEPPEYVSFSQMSLAAHCGEAYRRKYLAPVGTIPALNIYTLFGSVFHSAVEEFETHWFHQIREKVRNMTEEQADKFWLLLDEDLLLRTKRQMRIQMTLHGVEEKDLIFYGKHDLKYFYVEKMPLTVKSYLAQRRKESEEGVLLDGDEPIEALEVLCHTDMGTYPIKAVIDQVLVDSLGRRVLRDLKTGEPKPEHAMQLEVYRLAMERRGLGPIAYGQLLYVKREKPYVQVVKFSLDDEAVDEMINRMRSSILSSSLMVNGPLNGFCQSCDFQAECTWSSVRVRGVS